MTLKELKKIYQTEQMHSIPDMEMLWQKIDSSLTEKKPTADSTDRKNRHITLKVITAAVACIAVMLIIPAVFSEPKNSMTADTGAAEIAEMSPLYDTDECIDAAAPAEENAAPAQDNTDGSYSTESFSEEDVLIETECFVDAVVNRVYASGDCTYYELSVTDYYSDSPVEPKITVSDTSPYQMEENCRYFIPLKKADGEYRTVSPVPQIEITDSSIVYYEGWVSLDSENSGYIGGEMKTAPKDVLQRLIEKWKAKHQ